MYEDTRVGAFGAHPRSRGENLTRPSYLPPGRGSSPLTRGKLRRGNRLGHVARLIPAHAGKTIGQIYRVAGDGGSSPLTRGKLVRVLLRTSGQRLIPAHAGKTGAMGAIGAVVGAHPRSRGENPVRCLPDRRHMVKSCGVV